MKLFISVLLFIPGFLFAEGNWPKEIKTAKSAIIIYQPQPDSMVGDHLYTRAAISFTTPPVTSPVFGAVWTDSRFSTDRESGICSIYNVKILNVRFPGIDTLDPAKVVKLKQILEGEATSWSLDFSLDELKSSLALNKAVTGTNSNFKNDPPEIIFEKQNSVLILFEGDPVYREIENSGLKYAINTPFFIIQDMKDQNFYLFGSGFWYKSADPVKSAWVNIPKPPSGILKYYDALKKQGDKTEAATQKTDKTKATASNYGIPQIVVRTHPSELIQTRGEPKYTPIQGTQLLYVTNTDDNIFMTIEKNQYYILISGRWYQSSSLNGPWSFLDSDQLPPDFAKIPEGSEKDVVLASIAGTAAAKDAVMDAQIPQTAAVDRKTAKCEVKYDGDPKFGIIKGTELARGLNTASTVLLYKNTYYVCDNAVWFTGRGPTGPWEVATSIPGEIQKIPPDDPSYHVKYVYVYDVQPDVVFIGYTPGYTGCYIYGPTVVYGTGWPYSPFYGPYYYPRPVTFGFSMNYNPWYGWSMGFSMSMGWFSFSMGGPMGRPGGWWGPPMYHPPCHPPYNHYYGPRAPVYRGGNNTININNSRNTNIYNQRSDGSIKPGRQPSVSSRPLTGDRPGNRQPPANDQTRPGNNPGTRDVKPSDRTGLQKNNVYTDRKGDVYRNDNGNWQKNNGKNWESVQPKQQDRSVQQPKRQERSIQPGNQDRGNGFNRQEMDRQRSDRQRGTQNMNNRSSMQRSGGGGRKR